MPCLSSPPLQLFYPDHHVQMSLRVLFYNISNIIRLPGLLEPPPRHEILDFPNRPNRIPMSFCQFADMGDMSSLGCCRSVRFLCLVLYFDVRRSVDPPFIVSVRIPFLTGQTFVMELAHLDISSGGTFPTERVDKAWSANALYCNGYSFSLTVFWTTASSSSRGPVTLASYYAHDVSHVSHEPTDPRVHSTWLISSSPPHDTSTDTESTWQQQESVDWSASVAASVELSTRIRIPEFQPEGRRSWWRRWRSTKRQFVPSMSAERRLRIRWLSWWWRPTRARRRNLWTLDGRPHRHDLFQRGRRSSWRRWGRGSRCREWWWVLDDGWRRRNRGGAWKNELVSRGKR